MIKPGQLESIPGHWAFGCGPSSLAPVECILVASHNVGDCAALAMSMCWCVRVCALLLNANLAAWQINILANLLPTDSCQLYNHHQTMAMRWSGVFPVAFWVRGVHRPHHYLPGERAGESPATTKHTASQGSHTYRSAVRKDPG